MVNANWQSAFNGSLSGATTAIMAALLILLGIVLQLGALGYAHISSSNFWLVSMVTEGAWNLALHLNGPALQDVVRFWPLVLVGIGLGILMSRMERL